MDAEEVFGWGMAAFIWSVVLLAAVLGIAFSYAAVTGKLESTCDRPCCQQAEAKP